MFDLDTAVARWRNEIALSGRLSRDEVDELEDHLRAAFQDEVAGGLDPKDAFQFASSDLGAIAELTEEFSKVRTNTWRRVLVAGFALFAVSFALPVTSSGISLLGKPLDLGTIPGIEAFWYAITGELGLVGWFSALTNLLVAPALWKPSRRDRKGITVTAGVIVAATFLNLYWL
ncbi:MAG: hypothetical protein KDD65_08535, partial [Bacteroidetes bacterium]|nr:hypothetical protein [Bacteroidota bacterium]